MPRSGNEEKFVRDFVKAWTKVMNADRFDLALGSPPPPALNGSAVPGAPPSTPSPRAPALSTDGWS